MIKYFINNNQSIFDNLNISGVPTIKYVNKEGIINDNDYNGNRTASDILIYKRKMDFDNNQESYDKIFEANGLKVVCDLKSWLYLKNITIDYSDDMLNGGFKIENPNAERTCGCGTSFSA